MKNLNFDSYTDILLKTRERLTDPKNWCGDPKNHGLNDNGGVCLGLVMIQTMGTWIHGNTRDWTTDDYHVYKKFLSEVFEPEVAISVPVWNDSHTHAEVLELLDTAIAQRMQVAA